MCFTSLRALIWNADDGMVRVQDCIMSVFQSAHCSAFVLSCTALGRANHRNLLAAQKQSMCCPNAKMMVCEKCETAELIEWVIPGLYLIGHQ